MKRGAEVLNAREVRAGRILLRKARNAPYLTKQVAALLGRGPTFAARFAQAAKMAAYEGVITGLTVAILVKAAYDRGEADRLASEYEEAAWTQLASAIRFIGSAS